MEEILVLLFEFIFEVLLQILVELPWDLFLGSRESKQEQIRPALAWGLWSALIGAGVGGLSLLIHPGTFIKSSGARIAYLVLAPLLSALVSWQLSQSFVRRGREWITPRLHAICAFWFALTLTVIRFTYAHRQGH